MCLTDEVGCEVVVVRVLEQLLQETHQVAEHITVGTGQLWDQLKRKERGKKIGLSMTLKWKVAIFPQLWKSKLSKTEQGGLGWGLMRSPVCRGGYRGHSPDIVGRVRNTRPAPARPPRRSIVLRPLSGCNRLNESVKEEQKKKKVYIPVCFSLCCTGEIQFKRQMFTEILKQWGLYIVET